MKMYAVVRSDGGVSILQCNSDPAAWIARHWTRQDTALSIEPITLADVPEDRVFRDGWTCKGGKIDHDMTKCRDIHRQKMREARTPLLAALDVEYQRADEIGDNKRKQEIAKEKQRLRDCTKHPDIDLAGTVDDLKKVWPL